MENGLRAPQNTGPLLDEGAQRTRNPEVFSLCTPIGRHTRTHTHTYIHTYIHLHSYTVGPLYKGQVGDAVPCREVVLFSELRGNGGGGHIFS